MSSVAETSERSKEDLQRVLIPFIKDIITKVKGTEFEEDWRKAYKTVKTET